MYINSFTKALNNNIGKSLALDAAREALVLLQNNDSVLPIVTSDKEITIAMIGPISNDTKVMMGGKGDYCPEKIITLLEGLYQVVCRYDLSDCQNLVRINYDHNIDR